MVADPLIADEQLVGKPRSERCRPLGPGGVRLAAEVVAAVRELVAVSGPRRRRVAYQHVRVRVDEVVGYLELVVDAELGRDLSEEVLVGVALRRRAPRAGIEAVVADEDLGYSVGSRLRDPDADGIQPARRVGPDLLSRERSLAVLEIA